MGKKTGWNALESFDRWLARARPKMGFCRLHRARRARCALGTIGCSGFAHSKVAQVSAARDLIAFIDSERSHQQADSGAN